MTMTPSTPLKLGAVAFGVLWTLWMLWWSGSLDRVTVNGDKASIATIKDGLKEPTAVAKVGGTAWVTEGQLSHLFNAKANGPPRLPFEIVPVAVGN